MLGSDPPRQNPGTDGTFGTASYNPGADCTNPGDYHGAYTLGNDFPVYSSASWCCGDNVWKLNYDLYYVHDGNLEAGHGHDWEGVTIVFAKDPAASGDDWWHRAVNSHVTASKIPTCLSRSRARNTTIILTMTGSSIATSSQWPSTFQGRQT